MKNLIVTSMKDEALYCCEWIAYHKAIGFDHFHIYTNNNSDGTLNVLEKLSKLGFVSYEENECEPHERPQIKAFSKAVEYMHTHKPKNILCIDADEFLDVGSNIDEFLTSIGEYDAIAFNWKMFSSGGHQYKGLGFSIERFLMRASDNSHLHKNFKTLFKYNKDIVGLGPHRPHYKDHCYNDLKYLYSDGSMLEENVMKPGGFEKAKIKIDNACVSHYALRSLQEYKLKRSRGNALLPVSQVDLSVTDEKYFEMRDQSNVYDSSMLKYVSVMKEEYMKIITAADLVQDLIEEELSFNSSWK